MAEMTNYVIQIHQMVKDDDVNKNEKKQEFLEDKGIESFIEKLVPLLVKKVEMYEKHIFNMCLALKCLELIVGR